jgi:hypothetical protein
MLDVTTMSPELTLLDDLTGGDIPLEHARLLFQADNFSRAILAMLKDGEIRLLDSQGTEVAHWQRADILSSAESSGYRVAITNKGAARIA